MCNILISCKDSMTLLVLRDNHTNSDLGQVTDYFVFAKTE